jgi:hypothetical protein
VLVPEVVDPRQPQLTDVDKAFCLEYLRNGFNASAAYRFTHPNASKETSWVDGSRVLGKPPVRSFIDAALAPYQMSADEALTRLALDARVDIRKLYDSNGKLLDVHLWPDDVVNSVRSVQDGPYGTKITLNDSQAARRTILEIHGKLRNPNAGDALRDLAEILAEKWKG